MKIRTFGFAILAMFASAAFYQSSAATVPAGAVLVVRTLHAISSVDVPGTHFPARLENNVTVNGKVVLPAGTKFSGKVVTSKRTTISSQRLTVDLTSVNVGGRNVPVTTAGAVFIDNNIRTRNNVSVSRANYTVASGKRIDFRLAQPLNF